MEKYLLLRSRNLWEYHLKQLYAYLFMVVGVCVAAVGLIFDAGQLVGKEGTGVDILKWLQHPPAYFFPILLGAVFVSLSLVWFRGQKFLLAEFAKGWRDLDQTRRNFEEKVSSLYMSWSGNPDLNAFKTLVEKAGYPAGLPLKDGDKPIWQYAAENLHEWEADRRILSDFCVDVYARQGNRLMPDQDEREAFDEIRRNLSKFWEDWGSKCFRENTMDERTMLSQRPGQEWMIPLLIYLEIARAHHYRSTGPGKRWLFQLGKLVTR